MQCLCAQCDINWYESYECGTVTDRHTASPVATADVTVIHEIDKQFNVVTASKVVQQAMQAAVCALPCYCHVSARYTLHRPICVQRESIALLQHTVQVVVVCLTSSTLLGALVEAAATVRGYLPSDAPLSSFNSIVCSPATGTSILATVALAAILSTSPMKLTFAGTCVVQQCDDAQQAVAVAVAVAVVVSAMQYLLYASCVQSHCCSMPTERCQQR
jgi:hypothetical protein